MSVSWLWQFWLACVCCVPLPVSSQVPEPNFWPDLSRPMKFNIAGTLGNCNSCTWISAQGMITKETPLEFREFLERNKDSFEGTNVHLNSLGGELGPAIQLGRIIRETGYGTVVAETAGRTGKNNAQFLIDDFLDSDDPVCASACVFAFVGGSNRAASQYSSESEETGYQKLGRLAVHQFYSFAGRNENFSSSERINDQLRTAALLEYLVEMGVSADLLSKALSVPPDQDMYWLTEDDIKIFGIDTFVSDVVARLQGYKNGVGVVELEKRTRRGNYRYEFFCGDELEAKLKLSFSVFEWPNVNSENWRKHKENRSAFIEGLISPLPGKSLVNSWSSKNLEDGSELFEVVFSGEPSSVELLSDKTSFVFNHMGGSYAIWLAQDMNLNIGKPFDGFYLLPRLCLQ